MRQAKRIQPGPGQESVWDYPRPPRVEPCPERIVVEFAGRTIVDSVRSHRVLETSHPPVYYIPPGDVSLEFFAASSKLNSFCEWKGVAKYFDIKIDDRTAYGAAWAYPQPAKQYEAIRGHLAFYAELVDACLVGNERVIPQPGNFYGGWITSRVIGPFKGGPGSSKW